MKKIIGLGFAAIALCAFRFGTVDLGHDAAQQAQDQATTTAAAAAAAAPVAKGSRSLGMAVDTAQDGDFDGAFQRAHNGGADTTSLTVFWDDLETSSSPVTFNPAVNNLAIANAYYPPKSTAVVLVIPVIDTVRRRMPPDLIGLPLNNPAVINRFKLLLDYVFTQIPDLTLAGLSIGNEVDGVLSTSSDWGDYINFYIAVSAYAHTKRPGLKVGVKATLPGLTQKQVLNLIVLNSKTDAVFATYYPLNADFSVKDPSAVKTDVDALCGWYSGREVDFLEAGYPSGAPTHSSDAAQATFVRNMFSSWDAHAGQIRIVNFVGLTDASPQQISDYQTYYGISDPIFLSYLGTLGLRTWPGAGANKPAFDAFTQEAHRRGW